MCRGWRKDWLTKAMKSPIGEIEHLWTKGKRCLPPGEEVISEVRVVRFPVRRLPFAPRSYRAMQRTTLELSRLPFPVGDLLTCPLAR